MRPARFQQTLVDLVKQAGHPLVRDVATLADAGDSKRPFGVALRLATGDESRWQVIAQSAPGENYEEAEVPVEGDPMTPVAVPDLAGGKPSSADVEAWLAGLLAASGSREIRGLEAWSQRPEKGSAGITVDLHSGGKVYVRAL